MAKHIEMIEEYIIEQSDSIDYNPLSYIWTDNHGRLIRCRDCKFAHLDTLFHQIWCGEKEVTEDFYCAKAEPKKIGGIKE